MKINQMKTVLWSSVVASVLSASVVSCGNKSGSDETSDETATGSVAGSGGGSTTLNVVSADTPVDSTGSMSTVSLGFGKLTPVSALALNAVSTVDVGGGVVLSDARISIGSIKIKANKEQGESEQGLKQTMKDEKKARELAMEADKKLIEQEKEAIEVKYGPQFEGASETEKSVLKEQMKAEKALIEVKLAALEAGSEAEMDALEAQRDGNLKWAGPYVYSLIDNSVVPAIPDVTLIDGSYKRIEFKVKPNRTLDGTDALLNNAVYLAGTATVNGTATPFTASFRVDEEFKLMGTGALKIDPSVTNALTVAFNPATWFLMVDFSAATVDATGTIVITPDSNPGIWQLIRENLKRSTKFGEDNDGDGELKADESAGGGDEAVDEEKSAESAAE